MDQTGPRRRHRLRRGDRRQSHPDQRARGALRDPGPGSGQCRRRQGGGHGGGRRPGHRSRHTPARRSRASSTPIRRSGAPASCRRSRMRCWPTDSPRAARRSRSPRASSRASNSSPTIFPFSGLRIQVDAAINPGQQRRPGDRRRQDDRTRVHEARGRRHPEHRVHHSERGGRSVLEGHRRRPLRRQACHVRRAADAGEPGAARLPQARQVRRGHGGAPSLQGRGFLSAQGVGRHHPHRRHAHRQSGHGQDRPRFARGLRVS